jgi:hypothetical protein
MSAWILDYDDRSDDGPLRVGPFPTKEAAEGYAASLRGPGWSASYCVTPLAAPTGPEHVEPTPHVCQFCDTPLRDHWWDPCSFTPAA